MQARIHNGDRKETIINIVNAKRVFIGLMTTKSRKIAERYKPSSGRKGDHEVGEGACVSIRTNIAKNP